MNTTLAFYTVLCEKKGYPVKYIDPETWKVQRFCGPFADPGEASQEFKARVGHEKSCYLTSEQFQAKARAFSELRRRRQAE
jgi:hypothetical protein